jgi:hypothetical protein
MSVFAGAEGSDGNALTLQHRYAHGLPTHKPDDRPSSSAWRLNLALECLTSAWARLDSNQGPIDYESTALTN